MKTHSRVNQEIRSREVRLIGADGSQIGIVAINEAIDMAKRSGLDLVEIAENAKPPVCKILDYGKFKFEQSKKEKESRKKQREAKVTTKELWFRPVTDSHDIEFKVKRAEEFLKKGNRVKLGMRFKGRELSHLDSGKETLQKIVDSISGKIVQPISLQGRNITITIGPDV